MREPICVHYRVEELLFSTLASPCPAVYRPRRPQSSPLYRLVQDSYENVKGTWEERFETQYCRWRGFVDDVVYAFSDCGDLSRGFARVYCDACRSEYLLAFSCARRGFCPSCAAKRGAIFGAFLQEEVLEAVGHCLWTFTVPKLLRPFFLHRRRLLGPLCRAAWETVADLVAEAAGRGVRPGMVAAMHTASSDLRWHPHVHTLASRGGWDRDRRWHPVPYIGEKAAEMLFRQKVLTFLDGEGLVGPERLELLDSWKNGHTGFSVHNRVTVASGDSAGLDRLARYLLRPALSLERLDLDGAVARYRHKRARRSDGEPFDRQELLARLLMHIPAPRLHLVRYYGHYSSAARARRRNDKERSAQAEQGGMAEAEEGSTTTAERRRLRRQWARLIRRIYEADPLLCECGHPMRVISFLTDPPVVDKILQHLEGKIEASERAPPDQESEYQLVS